MADDLAEAILQQIASGRPNKALRDLMRDGDQGVPRGGLVRYTGKTC